MDKISFKELTHQVFHAKYLILLCIAISMLGGFILYKMTPNEYASSVKLLAVGNDEQSQSSRLGSLASLAGINLNSSGGGVPTTSYEYILQSSSFLMDVVDEKIEFEGDSILIANYLTQGMIVGWKDEFNHLFKNEIPKIQYQEIKDSTDKISISRLSAVNLPVLSLTGELGRSVAILGSSIQFKHVAPEPITITINLQHPEASANVAKVLVGKLEKYLDLYTKENQQDNTAFIREQLASVQKELYSLQSSLANAQDRNINANRAIANLEVERLNLRYSQARSTYSDLLLQLENSKIQTDKDKPLFMVVEPPLLRNIASPTAPRLVIYILLSIVVGFFASLSFVFARKFIKRNFTND